MILSMRKRSRRKKLDKNKKALHDKLLQVNAVARWFDEHLDEFPEEACVPLARILMADLSKVLMGINALGVYDVKAWQSISARLEGTFATLDDVDRDE